MTVSNYIPISLLSVSSKVSEKLMYKHLNNFLEVRKILYNLQFGFCASHSINHALITLTEYIKNTLDNKDFACGIFLYLRKAFDTVNWVIPHQITWVIEPSVSDFLHFHIAGTN